MEIQSPAKINLFLEVCGKRPDGYHNLNTLMCCIELYDTIQLTFGQKEISVHCAHPDVPEDKTNLAWRAAQLFFDNTRIHDGIRIDIEKNIPIGAGLGGGSSNAAAVLKGLNSFYGSPVSNQALMTAGKSIGADVPYFIYGKPAVATGIGDILTPCDCIKSCPILLVYPSVPVSTAEVYKKLNLTLTKNKKINTKILFELKWGQDVAKQLFNDLESVATAICPEIQEAKASLLTHYASAALMTGSGSAVFGLYENIEKAKKAYNAISQNQMLQNRMWQLHLSHLVV
ncbi:MAG: 4-(cytidine 5'-diphospho)-2-C-methyl-D-erythritol kinase [Desulfobacteraceae bacterium]|nr:4-(cytidine 5'-diphospho)-2-C-methyl-D-erythritol kinase [Desulfobacteraceae bacterium]MBC2756056.1 4-(cytidine 5'-diphospho)-2-C-methyl-D-erythritol kinase [Desulfobacteraceae bacterium]